MRRDLRQLRYLAEPRPFGDGKAPWREIWREIWREMRHSAILARTIKRFGSLMDRRLQEVVHVGRRADVPFLSETVRHRHYACRGTHAFHEGRRIHSRRGGRRDRFHYRPWT